MASQTPRHIRASKLAGRRRELGVLHDALAEARTGRGRAVFILGEPGIGKSRLARAAMAGASASGMLTLRGRSSEIGTAAPLRPLTEALLGLARTSGIVPDDLGPYRTVLGQLIPDWRGEGQAEPGSPVVLAEGVVRLLSIASPARGSLLVLEDLHDDDLDTLAVAEYMTDTLADQPAVVLCTLRFGADQARCLVERAERLDHVTRIDLRGLERPELAGLIADCLRGDPAAVKPSLVEEIGRHSGGNPSVIEELLRDWANDGTLVHGPQGWGLADAPPAGVPSALVRHIAVRTDRLGRRSQELLRSSAVLGDRFPLRLLGRMAGLDDAALAEFGSTAVAAHLIEADGDAPGWYAFAHPLTGPALRSQIGPRDQAGRAAHAADAIEQEYPGLPGDWCGQAARLRILAGQGQAAHELLVTAADRARRHGDPNAAASLLERAYELAVTESSAPEVQATTLAPLLTALAEAGRSDRAFELAEGVAELASAGLSPVRQAALHVALAGVAKIAGTWAKGQAHLRTARGLLGRHAQGEDLAPVDAMAAHLALGSGRADRLQVAESLARRALAAAERHRLPSIACDAWNVLGTVLASRDLDRAQACFKRVVTLAEQHRLPATRVEALVRLGVGDWLAEGSTKALGRARDEAAGVGAGLAIGAVDAVLVLDAALRSEFDRAEDLGESVWRGVSRTGPAELGCQVLVARAIAAAHRGRRQEMENLLAGPQCLDEGGRRELPLASGLARAFCALLEDDADGARSALDAAGAAAAENLTTHYLSGRYGLSLLLDVLSGERDGSGYREIADSAPARLRWNRHFVALARAVLQGREGMRAEAARAMGEAAEAGRIYPMAKNLGLRLIAIEAYDHGWGEPAAWLRQAEDHFFHAGLPAMAGTCRALQRRTGTPVRQRRLGTERVPQRLRNARVTAREYEVLELVANLCTNRDIAAKLCLSPRTVERHIANLLTKTGRSNRVELRDYYLEYGVDS